MELSNLEKAGVLRQLLKSAGEIKYSSTIQAKIANEIGSIKAEETHIKNASEVQKQMDILERELAALNQQ